MKLVTFVGAASLLLGNAAVNAGGIDRTGQTIGPLFEAGNYFELGFGHVAPNVRGADSAIGAYGGGTRTGNVLGDFSNMKLAYKHAINDQWSAALIFEQPFGTDILYPSEGSLTLGGTSAEVNSSSLTGLLRYKIPSSEFSVHGGVRAARTEGLLTLGGALMGPVSGYKLESEKDTAFGWVAGVAWERPEIGARVSLTYNSEIKHDFAVVESGPLPTLNGASSIQVKLPESWNLEFQTGVAEDTLLFGSVRWADWSSFRIDPQGLWSVTGAGLVDLDNSTTYTLGVGHRFTDNWSGAASFSYEASGEDQVSPFSPANGSKSVTLAAIYTQDKVRVTTGVSYVALGDARPTVGGVTGAALSGSHVWGFGVQVGYSF